MKQFDPIFFTPPSGDTKRPRKLYKGSGGGDGGAAARESAEKSRVAAAIAELDNIFYGGAKNPQASSRETTYNKIGTDAVNKANVDLNKDKEFVTRDLGFMLARQGLSGGSRDVDVKKDILDKYQQGLLRASEIGTQTANSARSADEKTRVNLISSIQAGLDSGTAAQQAYEGMRTNALKSQDEANAVNLSGFFDSLRQLQQQSAYNDQFNQVANQQKRNSAPSATARYGGTTGGSY